MPDDRFLHPRLGHSEKVCLLTELEFRVWIQYQLTADDCGVMRCSGMTIQAANDRLAKLPTKRIDKCLTRLVEVGLVQTFQHQGRTYLYQRDWQDWQKVRYPRASVNPQPTGEALAACTEATRRLFEVLTEEVQRKHRKTPVATPKSSGNVSEIFPPPTRAGARERLEANATASATANGRADVSERAGRLLEELYPAWYSKFRHGARLRLVHNTLAVGDAQTVCELWSDERIEKLAQVFLTTDDPWISSTDRNFRIFAQKASWCDDRLTQAEKAAV